MNMPGMMDPSKLFGDGDEDPAELFSKLNMQGKYSIFLQISI